MNFNKLKKILFVLLFEAIIISSALWSGRVFAYNDTMTHPALTENVIRIYNANFEQKLSSQEIGWIRTGSIEEDKIPRPANHFFEPNSGVGIVGFANSKSWAQSSALQKISGSGDYSWPVAINAYVKGDKKTAFIALGHVLHLLEDKAVPAHTRLDEHLTEGDPYEKWAEGQTNLNFSPAPITVGQLSEAFDGLALYSNKYFFSKDTISNNKDLSIFKRFNKEFDGKIYECIKGNEGQCLLLTKNDISGEKYYLDKLVHSDYFSLLAPRAIAYGAGVVNLFIQEGERQKQIENSKSWWQKLRENILASIGSSLATGSLSAGLVEATAPEPANQPASATADSAQTSEALASSSTSRSGLEGNSATENIGIGQYSLPANTVVAQDKIIVKLPANTVVAQEGGMSGDIVEEITPDDVDIPSAIIEEINPSQLTLPKPLPSATPLAFLSGSGSAPSPSPSPDSDADTTPPETTITSAPAATVATTTATFIFESAENGSQYTCQLDNETSTSCTSPKEYLNLFAGSHNFKVAAKDEAGNKDATPASHTWNIDIALDTIITSAPAANVYASSTTFIFNSTYANSTFSCKLDSAASSTCISPKSYTGLEEGSHNFSVAATDADGNQDASPASRDWYINPPVETVIINAPANEATTSTAIFEFESSESDVTYECDLDNATSTCVSPKEYTNLADGEHLFKVSATYSSGEQDAFPAEYSWVVDVSPPELSNISPVPGITSVVISWVSNEAGIFQVEYGTSDSYGFLSATTSTSTLSLLSLAPETTYHYRLLAEDDLGNATTTSDKTFTTTAWAANVVISEIQLSGGTSSSTDEFVELYNPTNSDINLAGWRLTKKTASGITPGNLLTSFPAKTISAHGYFLITHPTGYDGGVPVDAVYSTTASIANNNTVILYSDAGQTVVDLVGFGTASSSETATIANPPVHQSVERKSGATATASTLYSGEHKWQGNGYDSNDNSADFVLQSVPAPQNSLMLSEPRSTLPNLSTASAWPTWQKNLARTGLSSASALASSTMNVKWTATSVEVFSTPPVLDSEGNIYIGRDDGLAKYSSDGALLWLYATSTSHTVPLILDDDSVVFRGDWGLFSVNSQGQQRWKYSLDGSAGRYSAPSILSDGTLITTSNEKVYAINQDATLKWVFNPNQALGASDSFTSPVIDSADNIYIVLDHYLYAIDKNGAKLWSRNDGAYSGLAMGSDNALYVSFATTFPNGGFLAIDKNSGDTLWQNENGCTVLASFSPAIDASGQVYQVMRCGGDQKKLLMYNANSTPSWSVDLASIYFTAPILTSDGKIYLADQKTLKIFDASDGALLASFNAPDDGDLYTHFGAVGSDGTVYIANQYTLYAIDDN